MVRSALPIRNINVACFGAGDALVKQRRAGKGQGEVLVIGLGGGSLPIYLHEVFSFNVECVDLDETVIRLARTHFGFQESSETPKLQVLSLCSWLLLRCSDPVTSMAPTLGLCCCVMKVDNRAGR